VNDAFPTPDDPIVRVDARTVRKLHGQHVAQRVVRHNVALADLTLDRAKRSFDAGSAAAVEEGVAECARPFEIERVCARAAHRYAIPAAITEEANRRVASVGQRNAVIQLVQAVVNAVLVRVLPLDRVSYPVKRLTLSGRRRTPSV
jgi:hypothetical protein